MRERYELDSSVGRELTFGRLEGDGSNPSLAQLFMKTTYKKNENVVGRTAPSITNRAVPQNEGEG